MKPHLHPGPVSLDAARRRAVGAHPAHVDAGYARTLIGDGGRNRKRTIWDRHPVLARQLDLALVAWLVVAAWIVVLAEIAGAVQLWQVAF